MNHSETPLRIGEHFKNQVHSGDRLIATCGGLMTSREEDIAYAAHIVKCVNAHDGLVELAQAVLKDVFASSLTHTMAFNALRSAGIEVTE